MDLKKTLRNPKDNNSDKNVTSLHDLYVQQTSTYIS